MPSTLSPVATEPPPYLHVVLACPDCQRELAVGPGGYRCTSCAEQFLRHDGQIDLRPRHPRDVMIPVTLPGKDDAPADFLFGWNGGADMPRRELPRPERFPAPLLDWLPTDGSGAALDLGCGSDTLEALFDATGYDWVGMDLSAPAAPIRADAHALPFLADSFSLVVSLAVGEHVRYPWVTVQEVTRVLHPGGRFLGTWAFLEPFHAGSHFHATHEGVRDLLLGAGLSVRLIAPVPGWGALRAIGQMGLFPSAPAWFATAAVAPLEALSRLWWAAGQRVRRSKSSSAEYRSQALSGSFAFVADKVGPASKQA